MVGKARTIRRCTARRDEPDGMAKKANRSLNNFVESTLMDAVYTEPNMETIAATKEARTAKNKETFDSVESLMEELSK